jgi:methanogenic corrinoid protein MtbC1
VLAAPSGEQHVVALRMVHNLLRGAGYDVVMLGPTVPIDALAQFAARRDPGAVCLSATMPVAADDLAALDPDAPGMQRLVGGAAGVGDGRVVV